jgi:hypothetical protein
MKLAGTFLLIALLHPAVATPQTTADGVRAFEEGDYATAARILRPLAEDTLRRDAFAQFYMASLYEHGDGMRMDLVRACALYFDAMANSRGAFSRNAEMRSAAVRRSLNKQESEECSLLQQVGLQHGFTPVTFALAFGHSISFELAGATIEFKGERRWVESDLVAPRGIRFLPAQYTEVITRSGKDPGQRHFIELLVWEPLETRDAPLRWNLRWHLFEVVRHDLAQIHSEDVILAAPEPRPVNPRDLAQVRVNGAGRAEWVVFGADERGGVIESDAEAKDRKEQARARHAAYARVDWTRVKDVRRVPAFAHTDADGCGHVFNFGWSDDRMEAISVRADKELLNLSTAGTFDIASKAYALDVFIHVFERPVRSSPFCTDVIGNYDPPNPKRVWKAISGTVHIELSPPGVSAIAPFAYRATIRISGAEFVSETGARVRQVEPITLTAIVGFVFG